MAMRRATRRRLILLGAVLAMVAGLTALWAARQARLRGSLARDRREGMAAYEGGEYPKAMSHLSRYVSRRRSEPEVLLAFADARRKVAPADQSDSHLRHALAVTRLAMDLQPDSAEGRVMLMEVAWELGYLTEANDAAVEVLRSNPTDLDARLIVVAVARATGRDEECVRAALAMADAHRGDFGVQMIALEQMAGAGIPLEDLRRFVGERRDAFEGRIASELLGARLALHERSVAATSQERGLHTQRLAEHLAAATSLTPADPAEALALIDYLDRHPGLVEGVSPDELIGRYRARPDLGGELLEYAVQRAWQRGDPVFLVSVAGEHPEASDLTDEVLGWLALALPGERRFIEELASRQSERAARWKRLADAGGQAVAHDITAARETLAPLLRAPAGESSAIARYIEAVCLQDLGEGSLAERQLADLADDPQWVRARVLLRDAALRRGDFRRALELIRADSLPGTQLLRIEAAVALDEVGYQWPAGEAPGRVLADRALMNAPDEPRLLALHGRAELAAGNVERAIEVADHLLILGGEPDNRQVLEFADRLAEADPARAEALRRAHPSASVDALADISREILGSPPSAEEVRERITAVTAHADAETRLRGELMIAACLDRLGDAGAAGEYQRLSEAHPKDARVQLAALASAALWQEPIGAEPVVGRLRDITGEGGVSWRVYQQKLVLLQDDSEAAAASAVVKLSTVIRQAENDVLALELMVEALTRVGDLERAAGYAIRAADADPRDLTAALNAVDALARTGWDAEAAARALGSAEIPSGSAPARIRRARLLERYGFADEALADWGWLARAEAPATRARAALALARAGRHEEACAVLEGLGGAEAAPADARVLMADTLAVLGRKAEGLGLLVEMEDPAGDIGRDGLIADFMASHARTPMEISDLEAFVRGSEEADAWCALIRTYMGRGMLDDARRVLADARARVRDVDALAAYDRALDEETELDPNAYLILARSGLSAIDTDWSLELSEQLDEVIGGRRSIEEFIVYLDGFVKDRPEIVLGWTLMGQAQASVGDRSGARATAQRMLGAAPTDARAALAATHLFRRLRMADEGLLAARAYASRLGAPCLESGVTVAEFALESGRPEEAWDAISAWRLELRSRSERRIYAMAGLRTDHVLEAADVVWGWEDADDDWLHEAIGMGALIADTARRRTWLETASQRAAGSNDRTRLTLAKGWFDLAVGAGDTAALRTALGLAERGAEDPVIDAALSRLRAGCLSLEGRNAEAVASYRDALRSDPDDADALNNLAFLLLTEGGDASEALGFARRAVEVLRDRDAPAEVLVDYVDTLGLAQLRSGRPEEALASFEEALAARPDYLHSVVGRAEALFELARPSEAEVIIAGLDVSDAALEIRIDRLKQQLNAYQ